MRRFTLVLPVLVSLGCATSDPTQRYRAAVRHRLAGDAKASQDALIALAHEAPETRAGRKARASLGGSGLGLGEVWVAGVLAAIAVPNFLRFQGRAKQAEAKQVLRELSAALRARVLSGEGLPPSLGALADRIPVTGHYVYFGAGLSDAHGFDAAAEPAQLLLSLKGWIPTLGKNEYKLYAVGNIDADDDLDVWSINQDSHLEHEADDLR